jgi:hypothetical protein
MEHNRMIELSKGYIGASVMIVRNTKYTHYTPTPASQSRVLRLIKSIPDHEGYYTSYVSRNTASYRKG